VPRWVNTLLAQQNGTKLITPKHYVATLRNKIWIRSHERRLTCQLPLVPCENGHTCPCSRMCVCRICVPTPPPSYQTHTLDAYMVHSWRYTQLWFGWQQTRWFEYFMHSLVANRIERRSNLHRFDKRLERLHETNSNCRPGLVVILINYFLSTLFPFSSIDNFANVHFMKRRVIITCWCYIYAIMR
jgi:hypothetical protein